MRRNRVGILVAAIALAALAAAPGTAYAVNAYGQTFVGQDRCLYCHGNIGGRWQIGQFMDTPHAKQMTDVGTTTTALLPPADGGLWPSPSIGAGLNFGPSDLRWTFGVYSTGYISAYKNDAPHTLSTGKVLSPVPGPADDWLMFDPASFDGGKWALDGPTGASTFFQNCAGCHFTGVTRPADKAYTLGNGATIDHSTETSYAGAGIQCEACHGTGTTQDTTASGNHWRTGVSVVRTKKALESQVCGQCHGTTSANEKNYTGGAFYSPNGYTPDRKLTDFAHVGGAQYVQQRPYVAPPKIPGSDYYLYPDGHNKNMYNGTYNEWSLSSHARTLRYPDGEVWTRWGPDDTCMPCHSGEGFLKSLGYGSDGNDIGLLPSTLASDTLDIECGVCHDVMKGGLRLPPDELCARCHTAGIAAGQEMDAVPDGGTTKEMNLGYGLIGVPKPAKAWMAGKAGCADCHMPKTSGTTPSHRFTPMLPGNAATWGVQPAGDSCTPCHTTLTRVELQSAIDTWQADIRAKSDVAQSALDAVSSRPASRTTAGKALMLDAEANIAFVANDGSTGVHNYPYASAGLVKAAYFAKAVGASVTGFNVTSYDPRLGVAAVYGKLTFGDGVAAAGEQVSIQARPAGATAWTTVANVTVGASGDFSCVVAPTGTTDYRSRWTARDESTAVYSAVKLITMGTSTTIAVSAPSLAYGGTEAIMGAVSPGHAGKTVTVQFKYGTAGSWKTLATSMLGTHSTYRVYSKFTPRGTYYLRTTFAGDASHTGSTSGVVSVRVY